VPPKVSGAAHGAVAALINTCDAVYRQLLDMGIAPEQARAFLPLCTYTELYMTASLAAYARVVRLRLDPHAQQEIREVASRISEHCATLWPVSWEALMATTPRPDPQPPIVSCPVP
jgi:thymidylate synthase ThyX